MSRTILVLPGDGVGPEGVAEALKVLEALRGDADPGFEIERAAIGGEAIDVHGVPLPGETLERARASDAILLGRSGGRNGIASNATAVPNAGCSPCGPSSASSRTCVPPSPVRSSPARPP